MADHFLVKPCLDMFNHVYTLLLLNRLQRCSYIKVIDNNFRNSADFVIQI